MESLDGLDVARLSAIKTPENTVVPSKKRGRPKKQDAEAEPAQWTIDMIRALMGQKQFLKDEFLDSKDKVSLARGWSKIVLHIQTKFNVDVTAGQVKSKYQLLQKAYRTHNAADKQTGNGAIPKKPVYWEELVNHFGGRGGLGHDCLLSSNAFDVRSVFIDSEYQNRLLMLDTQFDDDADAASSVPDLQSPLTTPNAKSRRGGNRGDDKVSAYDALGSRIQQGLEAIGRSMAGSESTSVSNDIKQLLIESKEQTAQIIQTQHMMVELLTRISLK